jgi:hypothetical protein
LGESFRVMHPPPDEEKRCTSTPFTPSVSWEFCTR